MPAERFYLDQDFSIGELVALEGTENHHLRHVMRNKVGDNVELVNGRGSLAQGQVVEFHKNNTSIRVENVVNETSPQIEVILAQAIPRLNRLDIIVEKGTELGMTQLWLFPSTLADRKTLTDHQLQRLQLISIAAMKQCGRLYLPEIIVVPPINKWKKSEIPLYFGDLDPAAPKLIDVLKHHTLKSIFVTGPESGFTDEEIHQLRVLGAIGVKLHHNILRTETASIVALALLTQ